MIGRAITGRSASARKKSRSESLGHDERVVALDAIAKLYAGANDDAFFGTPKAFSLVGEPVGRRATKRGMVDVVDLRWPSRVAPFVSDVADAFLAMRENHEAAARLFTARGEKRPTAIIIHGYRGGHYRFGERVWPVSWLLDHGLDVALFVLPFHAVRSAPGSGPRFPSSDPRFTNEGFRQATGDLRDLVLSLRERGSPDIAVMGMSLGGYTTALAATTLPDVDFAAPYVPLASIADFAREQGRLGAGEQADAQHAALERANWIVSPLARPLRIPPERALVVAAEHDQITPVAHAGRIATHFTCELLTIAGGHLVQIGRKEAFRALAAMLEREGIITARARRG